MKKIKMPDNSVYYILFQRTQYLDKYILAKILTYAGYLPYFYKTSIKIKSRIYSEQIKEEYSNDMFSEYNIIKNFLPENAKSILDIGCGVAGVDAYIANHYGYKTDIFLIDKTEIDKKVYYCYEKRGSLYNSLPIAKDLLISNGVDPNSIHLQEVTPDNKINFQNDFDVVISLISWGFHYPISTYLNQVYEKLRSDGILLLDIRKGTNGEKEIEEKFGNCEIISESPKGIRVMALR